MSLDERLDDKVWQDKNLWQECWTQVDGVNEVYYWNKLTDEVTWIPPVTMNGSAQQRFKLGAKVAKRRQEHALPEQQPPGLPAHPMAPPLECQASWACSQHRPSPSRRPCAACSSWNRVSVQAGHRLRRA